jgi:hypothetical protein
MSQTQANSMPQQPYKRQLKNFLLMPGFQLKYTGAIVVISALLCSGLGYVVHQRTQEAYTQTKAALESAEVANKTALESSKMLAMENDAMSDALAKADAEYAIKAKEIKQKATGLAAESHRTILYLGGFLGLLVLALAIFGIVMTHRIAGPLFVLSRMFQNIGQNNFHLYKRSLRRGDEFPEIFEKGVAAIDHLAGAARADNDRVAESLTLLETLESNGADPQIIQQIQEKLRGMSLQKAKIS